MPFIDSDPSTEELDLQGVWIHDPLDPEATVKHYPHGKAQRSSQIDTGGTEQFFAGREKPVVDYGEHTGRTYFATIDIFESLTHQDEVEELTEFAELKRAVVLRDNRGREMYGIIYGFVVHDANWGSAVQFSFRQVDEEITEVVA